MPTTITLGTYNPTYMDIARRLGENDKIARIIERMHEYNEILDDAVVVEGNLTDGHKTTIRTGLPEATWRKFNYGVQPGKSVTVQVTDHTGMLEARAVVDKDLVDLNGNAPAWRLSEDQAYLEGMNQQMAETIFYGSEILPESFIGLSPRFNLSSAENGGQIIKGGGSSTLTSIWLIGWGENTVNMIYPKGTKAGFEQEDKGVVTVLDAAGGRYDAYETVYRWKAGLSVRDWRYVVRIPNIDTAKIGTDANDAADLITLMLNASEQMWNLSGVRPAFYCNRTVRAALRRQILNKSNVFLTQDNVAGKPVLMFNGMPVRRCDQLLSTEAAIV